MNHQDKTENTVGGYLTMPVCRKTMSTEVSGDYILPDYQPELRRLLSVSGKAMPPAKYVGGGNVELDGTVEYQILYVGADGGLYSAPLSGEYNLRVPMENLSALDLNEGVCVLASCVPESITARVTAPRKLTLRCRMKCTLGAYGKMPIGERLIGDAAKEGLCRLRESVQSASLMSCRSEAVSLFEEFSLPFADARVVCADAGTLIDEVSVGKSETTVRGEVILKLLFASEDGMMVSESKKLPFEGTMECDELTGEDICASVRGYVSDLAVRVEENKAMCDVQLILDGHMGGNEWVSYTADLYSTERACQTRYATHEVPMFLHAMTANFSQSERMSASEKGIPQGATVIDVQGQATADSCEQQDGHTIIKGQGRYVFICQKDGEYSAVELTLPWRYECEGGVMPLASYDVCAEVVSCRGRISGDVLELDAELCVAGDWMGVQTIRTLESAEFADEKKKKSGDTVLCYPAPDDTLWNVAKKYMVAPEEIEGDPTLDPYLLIRE